MPQLLTLQRSLALPLLLNAPNGLQRQDRGPAVSSHPYLTTWPGFLRIIYAGGHFDACCNASVLFLVTFFMS